MFPTITPDTTPADLIVVAGRSVTDPTRIALSDAVRSWRIATAPAEALNLADVRLADGCPLDAIGMHTEAAEAFLLWVAAQEAPLAVADDETERTAQAQALATMRRREADAIADRDRYRAMVASQGPTTLDELKRHPLWQDLAREAAEAAVEEGFCGEYDRMARAIGLPDRDDVLGSRSYSRSFTVTLTITQSAEQEWGDGSPSSYVDQYDLQSLIDDADNVEVDAPSYVEWDED